MNTAPSPSPTRKHVRRHSSSTGRSLASSSTLTTRFSRMHFARSPSTLGDDEDVEMSDAPPPKPPISDLIIKLCRVAVENHDTITLTMRSVRWSRCIDSAGQVNDSDADRAFGVIGAKDKLYHFNHRNVWMITNSYELEAYITKRYTSIDTTIDAQCIGLFISAYGEECIGMLPKDARSKLAYVLY